VEKLAGESRLLELAQMLGQVGEGTLQSAHEILQTAQDMSKAQPA
jgi:DNA repair ATPase RecN